MIKHDIARKIASTKKRFARNSSIAHKHTQKKPHTSASAAEDEAAPPPTAACTKMVTNDVNYKMVIEQLEQK